MPRLSNMVGETGFIEIPVSNDEPLIVFYRRGKQTPRVQIKILTAQRELAALQVDGVPHPKVIEMMTEMLADLIVSWNLTDDNGNPVKTDAESLQDVNTDLLTGITTEIGRQAQVDPLNNGGSSNGLSAVARSEPLPTTTPT